MRLERSNKPSRSAPAPWGLALGITLVATCFVGANLTSKPIPLDGQTAGSDTRFTNEQTAAKNHLLSRNLASASLPQGASVTALHCTDSSGAHLEIERTGSEHILTGEFKESLISSAPVSLTFAFSGTKLVDEDGLVFEQGAGGLHTQEKRDQLPVQKLEIRGLQDRYGATLIVQTNQHLIELSHCQVNTAALFRLSRLGSRQTLASVK
jgi:hypothetical protein